MTPTLSVLVPNYNHARFIPEAFDALLSQSYRPLEIIVVDDASTDDSVAVLERYRAKHPDLVHVVVNEWNLGVVANLQRLLEKARGDYVFLPACDDRVEPGFLERSMTLLGAHPSAGLCSTLTRVIDEHGVARGVVKMPVVLRRDGYLSPEEARASLRRHGNWLMGNTAVYRRNALLEVGYHADLGPYADGFAALAVAMKHGACFVPAALASWRRMAGTYSQAAHSSAENSLRIVERAERLMRTEFASRFTEETVLAWRSEMHVGIASTCARRGGPHATDEVLRILPPGSQSSRRLLTMFRGASTLSSVVLRAYVFGKGRGRQIPRILERRWTHLRIASARSKS